MDIATLSTGYVPVCLSGNRVLVNIPALDPALYPDRSSLRYLLEVYVQSYFQAPTYELATLTPADANEYPPESVGGADIYRGADVEVQDILDGYLEVSPPSFEQTAITICPDLLRNFYTKYSRYNGNTLVDQVIKPSDWVIKGAISERDFAGWGKLIFSNPSAKAGGFLTWKPSVSKIYPDQPEYLYFLNNLTPSPSSIKLRSRIYYEDTSWEVITIQQIDVVTPMTVYCVPVGPQAMGLGILPKVVAQYEVWLSNQDNERISEVRSYILNYEYKRQKRYILFQNSFGVFDTLPLVGIGVEKMIVSRQISERYPAQDLNPSYAERVIDKVTGEAELSLNTGWLTKELRLYLQELLFSKSSYIVGKKEHYPLIPQNNDYVFHDDDEDLVARTLVFRYTNPTVSGSFLPLAPSLPTRSTGWRGHAEACDIDTSTGLRIGMKRYGLLVQYYLDTGLDVEPRTQKPNVPGTVGYIPPTESLDCAPSTTPYLNTLISKASSFRRNNCADGRVGMTWNIQIPAGTYGSHLSQEDANAKAQAAWQALDTQANANLNGTCELNTTPLTITIKNTVAGSDNLPIAALFIAGVSIVPNTSYNPEGQSSTINPGTYNLDVQIVYSSAPFEAFRIKIPKKSRISPVLSGVQTYRFENVNIYSSDNPLEIIVEND
ncbi:MAG: DUF5977 domain-containing protein [Runella zeae]